MKKRDEGYVLAFVLVVIVVICLVAVSMMTVSLRNLEAQTASVERMQEKYKLQGMMEENISAITWEIPFAPYDSDEDKKRNLKESFTKFEGVSAVNASIAAADEGADDVLNVIVDLKLSVPPDGYDYVINAVMHWEAKIIEKDGAYEISESETTYTSYEVVPVETGVEHEN